jgi:hypothetical protein
MTQKQTGLAEALHMIEAHTQKSDARFQDIVTLLQKSGDNHMLLALLIILPVGAIPGVPAFCSIVIFLVALQALLGVREIWFPQKLRNMRLPPALLQKIMLGTHKSAALLERLTRPRLGFMTKSIFRAIAIIFVLLLAVATLVAGFVPFAPTVLMLPVVLLGIGLSGSDGLMTLFGFASSGAALGWLPFAF